MNVWSVAALGIGAMVGAGIFALLGQAALIAGSETYIAFLIGAGVAALSGYSYAKLAARYPQSGGISAYFDEAFGVGRLAGTLTLIYLVTLAVTIAMVARTFGAYAGPLLLNSSDPLWIGVFGSAILLLLTLLNPAGRQLVGRMELLLVAIKLLILTGLMLAGLVSTHGQSLSAQTQPSTYGILASVGLTFFAYAGFGMMANAAGSVTHPERTIPRAICLAIAVVAVLYVGLAVVVLQSISPANLAAHADTAVAEAARPVLGHFGFVVVSIAALLATASAINATLFSAIRIAAALADTGRLPGAFKPRFWRNGSNGLVVSLGGVLLTMNFLHLKAIAGIASATFLIACISVARRALAAFARDQGIADGDHARWPVDGGRTAGVPVARCHDPALVARHDRGVRRRKRTYRVRTGATRLAWPARTTALAGYAIATIVIVLTCLAPTRPTSPQGLESCA